MSPCAADVEHQQWRPGSEARLRRSLALGRARLRWRLAGANDAARRVAGLRRHRLQRPPQRGRQRDHDLPRRRGEKVRLKTAIYWDYTYSR
ncbi:unnamed protein product [Cladocopium goreaui]|uniref:Integrase catalytic domain-containing protein n=1 Tax=Cladocopium goreaui TaxID=2562237 RepID=A0A9P1M6D9_9DINO|nr:unnamed protein product [Cladocopium goreaui]